MEYENQYLNVESKYDCLLFACRKNIEDYMLEKLGIEESKISELNAHLYKAYGTTMAGLRAIGYNFDYDDYHSIVHGRLPYQNLKHDHVLRGLLLNLPYRKVLFTNGDRIHAAKSLKRLGLEDCFETIICFETLNPANSKPEKGSKIYDIVEHFSLSKPESELPKSPVVCKPYESAIEEALEIANINPKKTMFFDDSVRNIQAGKRVGLHTVLVGTSHRVQGADFALESIHNIREALPELWEPTEKSEVRYSGKIAIETSVEA
ncbi:hypothetical protein ACHQM5_010342 [Ranunculus cassubicifolius]